MSEAVAKCRGACRMLSAGRSLTVRWRIERLTEHHPADSSRHRGAAQTVANCPTASNATPPRSRECSKRRSTRLTLCQPGFENVVGYLHSHQCGYVLAAAPDSNRTRWTRLDPSYPAHAAFRRYCWDAPG